MSAARLNAVPSAQGHSLSVAIGSALVMGAVACLMCALLALLYARHWISGEKYSQRPRSALSRLEKNYYYTHAISTSSFGCAGASTVADSNTPAHSQWHAQPSAIDYRAACSTQSDRHSAEALPTIQKPKPQGRSLLDATVALPTDCRNSSLLDDAPARRLGLDLERAWLKPLPLAHTKSFRLEEQLLWRNSSGGSSCYSRLSSWYSVANAGGSQEEELRCELGAGPGPTIQVDTLAEYRHKALPPLPKQTSNRCMTSTVADGQNTEVLCPTLYI